MGWRERTKNSKNEQSFSIKDSMANLKSASVETKWNKEADSLGFLHRPIVIPILPLTEHVNLLQSIVKARTLSVIFLCVAQVKLFLPSLFLSILDCFYFPKRCCSTPLFWVNKFHFLSSTKTVFSWLTENGDGRERENS